MHMSSKRQVAYLATAGLLAAVALSTAVTDAAGRGGMHSSSITTGATVFVSSGCGGCHTFTASRATGKLGPNLDKVRLSVAQITTQIARGGAVVLGKAAAAKYKIQMPSFKGRLSKTQIAEVATFVYAERNKPPVGGTTGGGGGGTTTTTSGGGGGTTTTPKSSGGGGGGGDTSGCPPGVTIKSSGVSDADGDELGTEPDDNDGCV